MAKTKQCTYQERIRTLANDEVFITGLANAMATRY